MRICAYQLIETMPTDHSALRRTVLRQLLERETITSQEDLRARLANRGHHVAQTTISRDLAAIGARKVTDQAGGHYALAEPGAVANGLHTVAERMRLFVVSIEASGTLVVVKTPPGSAHSVAVALDASTPEAIPELLGTIAGDDTMFVAARPPYDGNALASRLSSIMETVP
jgi:transcriptional regulator of arginine metabolism